MEFYGIIDELPERFKYFARFRKDACSDSAKP
jgi:hypothetical protein